MKWTVIFIQGPIVYFLVHLTIEECVPLIVYYLTIVYKNGDFKEIPYIGGLYYLYSLWT